MPRNYTTLFDSRYLSRGLAMIESLIKHSSEECRVFVLPLDEECARALDRCNLKNVVVTGYRTFEYDQNLAAVRKQRTHQEFAWTCASNYAEWLFNQECVSAYYLGNSEITYLDADLLFFSNPEQIFDEIGDRSIGIIPHRFEGPKIASNGKFNVSFVSFKGEVGQRCLSRWAEQCREWCYYRVEPGRFGDQKYLDEWPSLYGDEVCVIQNPGAGAAPWNLQQYRVTEGPKVDGRPLIFYHFHEFKDASNLTNYPLRQADKALIYQPYIEALEK